MDDTNKNILEMLTKIGFKVEDELDSSSLHENLERVNIELSGKEFESFEKYLYKKQSEKLRDELKKSQENVKLRDQLKKLRDELKQSHRDNIISNLFSQKVKSFQSFHDMSVYLKDVIANDVFVDYSSRRNRISDVISTKLSKSSVRDQNNMNCFHFSRMSQPCARQMKKIIFQQTQLTEMITHYHFNGRSEAYNRYITMAMEYLNIFRAIFECHFQCNPEHIREVTQFQPLFQCFLRQLMTTLDEIANTIKSSSSNSLSTSSLIKLQKVNVEKANHDSLYFKAEVFTNSNKSKVKQIEIKGFTDLIVSVGTHNTSTWDSVSFIIELKPPPTFSVNGDFEAEKNQVFAQLLGLKTKFDKTNLNSKIPKACLTDGFAIYICFLYNNVYYISGHTLKAEDYINALLFQLCDINAEELNKLIEDSIVTSEECIEWVSDDEENIYNKLIDDDSTTTNNDDKSPKRSKRVFNFNYEDKLNEYQSDLAYLTRLENRIWGYTHMDEESLQNCVPNIGQNPSDYVMSKFLNDT